MPHHDLENTRLREWLRRLQAGDRSAEDELLRGVQHDLQDLTLKMLKRFPGVGRWVEVEDVLQQVLLRLMRALKQYTPASRRDFFGLAAEQIRRELIDSTRHYYGPQGHGTHHATTPIVGDLGGMGLDLPEIADDPEELEKWSAFHKAVAELPTEEREVMSLIFYHSWTQLQVAELLGVTERTVRRHKIAAFAKLRRQLKCEGLDV
jgi:RNA polymerase sigma factor (sigma-70 family)